MCKAVATQKQQEHYIIHESEEPLDQATKAHFYFLGVEIIVFILVNRCSLFKSVSLDISRSMLLEYFDVIKEFRYDDEGNPVP